MHGPSRAGDANENARFDAHPRSDHQRAPHPPDHRPCEYYGHDARRSHPQHAHPHGQARGDWDACAPSHHHAHDRERPRDRRPPIERSRGPWRDERPERRGGPHVARDHPYRRPERDARQSRAAEAGAAEAGAAEADGWAQRRAHYDQQAQPDQSRARALRDRGRGPLIAYKKAANALKRAQVDARRGVALLADVGCGRGGDIGKWWDARIAHVIATDLAPNQLDEARRRQAEMAAERAAVRGFVGRIDWHACNSADGELGARLLRWSGGRRYDALSCQFALQFFFGEEQGARALLRAVAGALVDGGQFFGIAPDGDAILALTAAHGGAYEMATPFSLRVRLADGGAAAGAPAPTGPADPGAFGRLATFALDDTVTAGSDESDCSEFLLHPSVLRALARDEGLEPIDAQCGPMLEQLARATRLAPLSAPLQRVASLYFCFAFVKTAGAAGGGGGGDAPAMPAAAAGPAAPRCPPPALLL